MRRLLLNAVFFLAMIVGFNFVVSSPASAFSGPITQFAVNCRDYDNPAKTFFGFPSWDDCLDHKDDQPIIDDLNDIWLIAFPVVEIMIRAAGYLAIGFILWGGLTYIRNDGDPSRIVGAKKTIINALIGLIIAVLSVALVRFVAGTFN